MTTLMRYGNYLPNELHEERDSVGHENDDNLMERELKMKQLKCMPFVRFVFVFFHFGSKNFVFF